MNVIVLHIVTHFIMYSATHFYYHYLKIIQKILQYSCSVNHYIHRESFADTTIFYLFLFCYRFIIFVNINYYTEPHLALQARLVTINTCYKLAIVVGPIQIESIAEKTLLNNFNSKVKHNVCLATDEFINSCALLAYASVSPYHLHPATSVSDVSHDSICLLYMLIH